MPEPTAEELEMRRRLDGMLIQRLDGIESEIKAMRDLLVKSAQLEERMVRVMESNARLEIQNAELFRRISSLETTNATSKEKVGNTERVVWVVISTALAVVTAWFTGNHK